MPSESNDVLVLWAPFLQTTSSPSSCASCVKRMRKNCEIAAYSCVMLPGPLTTPDNRCFGLLRMVSKARHGILEVQKIYFPSCVGHTHCTRSLSWELLQPLLHPQKREMDHFGCRSNKSQHARLKTPLVSVKIKPSCVQPYPVTSNTK